MNKIIITAFIVIGLLVMGFSYITIYKINELSNLTQQLYQHPFKVINTTKNIQANLISIHRHMKNILLSKDKKERDISIRKINKIEIEIYDEYKIIFENYLGDKQDIQVSYDAFMQWEAVRDEVVSFIQNNEIEKAQKIKRDKAYKYVNTLNSQVEILISHAEEKAKYFLLTTSKKKEIALEIIYTLTFTILLFIFIIFIVIRRKMLSFQKDALQSFNHLNTVLNTSSNAIIAMNNKMDVLNFNKSAQKMFGYTLKEMQEHNNLQLILPEEYIDLLDAPQEMQARRKDGSLFPIKVSKSYSGDEDNFILVVNIIDISLEKKQEAFILQQSRLAQMGEMISMIAHQWRQPLGSISTTAANLKLKIELDFFPLDTQKSKEECNDYVKNLTSTIDDFRNFYKPNKDTCYVSIEEVIMKALNIIEASLKSDNIEIIYSNDSSTKMQLYENELMQVFLNILKNAQDNFIEKEIKNPKLMIIIHDTQISITDNGGGIPEHIMLKIFDPYFSTKDEKNGTGLGLYMSKTIIEEHHKGKLEVSNTDDGVCFKIDLFQN